MMALEFPGTGFLNYSATCGADEMAGGVVGRYEKIRPVRPTVGERDRDRGMMGRRAAACGSNYTYIAAAAVEKNRKSGRQGKSRKEALIREQKSGL